MRIQGVGNTAIDVMSLFPQAPPKPKELVDMLKPKHDSPIDLNAVLSSLYEMRWAVISFSEKKSEAGYEKYLQFPNPVIDSLTKSIVLPMDTNDQKMRKIEQWVQENIKYVSDETNYGQPELWAYPTVTLMRESGDCEDGAFLMHSLALHAGIPSKRLRTYGGLVWADDFGLTTGGHAWTSYKREVDNAWIITDWCYWTKDTPLSERQPMSDDLKYIDDYFYVEAGKTVETPYANKVRYAILPKGMFVNRIV